MEIHFVLITLGGLFLIGLATDELGRRTRLPRVTLLMLFGVLIGPAGLDILPHQAKDWYEFLTSTALTMVAFLLGGALSFPKLHRYGKEILITSFVVVTVSVLVVGGGLLALGVGAPVALVLAAIATATAPEQHLHSHAASKVPAIPRWGAHEAPMQKRASPKGCGVEAMAYP